jgi:hypothetical protein
LACRNSTSRRSRAWAGKLPDMCKPITGIHRGSLKVTGLGSPLGSLGVPSPRLASGTGVMIPCSVSQGLDPAGH